MIGGSRKKFSGGERRAEGRMRLFRARGSAELREVASSSTTQSLWLRSGKVRFQVSGVDEANSLREEQLGKLGKDEEERATERRRKYTDLGLDLGEREEQVACHASALALAITDEVRREEEM